MYIKLAKILALGAGALVTTGIPSGPLPVVNDPARMCVSTVYEIDGGDQSYVKTGKDVLEASTPTANRAFIYDPESNAKLGHPQKPTPIPTFDAKALGLKSKNGTSSKVERPIRLSGSRITLAGFPAVSRFVRPQPGGFNDNQDSVIGRSEELYQPPTCRYQYEDEASDLWWLGDLKTVCDGGTPWRLQDGTSGSSQSLPVQGKSAEPAKDSPVVPESAVVPEPAGLLAILAGLPGLAIFARRRK